MKKRTLLMFLILAAIFSLTSCTGDEAENDNDIIENEKAVEKEEKINDKDIRPHGNVEFRDSKGNVLITIDDIESVEYAVYTDNDGTNLYQVQLNFTDDGKQKFAKITGEMVGEQLGVYVDGELIQNPTVQEPILDGVTLITNMNYEDAKELVNRIKGKEDDEKKKFLDWK